MNSSIEKKILMEVSPSKEEHDIYESIVKKFIKRLKRNAKKLEFKCDFYVGGSFGKNTYLKNYFDVDIFCRFDMYYDDSKLSQYIELILIKSKFKYKLQKGSRDYYTV